MHAGYFDEGMVAAQPDQMVFQHLVAEELAVLGAKSHHCKVACSLLRFALCRIVFKKQLFCVCLLLLLRYCLVVWYLQSCC